MSKMSARPVTLEHYYKILRSSLPIALVYSLVVVALPIFAIIDAHELFPYLALMYQIVGIILLYIDERYKMSRESQRYGKANTFFWKVLKSPFDTCRAIKKIYRIKKNPLQGQPDINFSVSATPINHDYNQIKDEKEREKNRIISFESDLRMLRYFSEIRRAAYFILGMGFILQFLAIVYA